MRNVILHSTLYKPDIKSALQEDLLCDHIGLWCVRCLGYLESHEVAAYSPYERIPSVDDPWLQVALEKVLSWTVPIHRYGCPSGGLVLSAATAGGCLDPLLLCHDWELENLANSTFHRGNLNLNMAIRLALSCRHHNKGNEEEEVIQLAKATISNGGSSRSEVVGQILDSHMPPVLNDLPYQKLRVLLALGNRYRNIGRPYVAKKEYYAQARYILSNMLPEKAQKAQHALERRELSVRQRCASLDEAKGLIKDAEDDAEQYGVLTTRNYIGLDNLRKNEYVQAEDNFREMEMLLEAQNENALVSWWHKMAVWLGLGATVYANDPKRSFEEALRYCLKAEYVSAMLGLQVDVTRDVSEQLLSPGTLLSPSAVVRRIGKEKNIAKERMEELRRTALIESGLQKEPLAELRIDNRNLKVQARNAEREIREDHARVIHFNTEKEKRQHIKQQEMQKVHRQTAGKKAGHNIAIDLGGVKHYNDGDSSATSTSLLQEVMRPREWEAARAQLEKKFRDGVETITSSNSIPAERKVDILNKTEAVVHEIFNASQIEETLQQILQVFQQNKGEKHLRLPTPGENYPLYPGRTDALAWLEEHWGHYLKHFNPNLDRDYLYQYQLRKLDMGLYQGLKGQMYIRKGNIKFRDIVPPKKERINKEIEVMSMEAIRKAARSDAALRMRRIRAALRMRRIRAEKTR